MYSYSNNWTFANLSAGLGKQNLKNFSIHYKSDTNIETLSQIVKGEHPDFKLVEFGNNLA